MWIHRLTAIAIVAMSSSALRVAVIPAVDEFVGPQKVQALITSGTDLNAMGWIGEYQLRKIRARLRHRSLRKS